MIPELIEQLIRKAGMTEAAIGDAVGCHQSTVNRLRKGQVPHFNTGRKIVELHDRKFPPKRKRARRVAS